MLDLDFKYSMPLKENLTNYFLSFLFFYENENLINEITEIKKYPPLPPTPQKNKTNSRSLICFTGQLINVGDLNKLPLHSMKTI